MCGESIQDKIHLNVQSMERRNRFWEFVLKIPQIFFFFQHGLLFLDSQSQAGGCVTHVDVESECV